MLNCTHTSLEFSTISIVRRFKSAGWKITCILFFGLSRTRTVAEAVETVKTSSSKWTKTKGPEFSSFHWQSGYGVFSVSQSDSNAVVVYIRDQEQRHAKMTFQDEYRLLLQRYQIAFDERYVWD